MSAAAALGLIALGWLDVPRAIALVLGLLAAALVSNDEVEVVRGKVRYTNGWRTRNVMPESLGVGRYGANEWIVEAHGTGSARSLLATVQPTMAGAESLRERIEHAVSEPTTHSPPMLAKSEQTRGSEDLVFAAVVGLVVALDVFPAAIALVGGCVALAVAVYRHLQVES